MSTIHQIARAGLALSITGLSLGLLPTTATAAEPEAFASLSTESLDILAAYGFSVDFTTSPARGAFTVRADDGSGLVYGYATYAQGTLPVVPAGVSVMNDAKNLGWIDSGEGHVMPAVRSSWRQGGTDEHRSMTWLVDDFAAAIPADLLAEADIFGHDQASLSDATTDVVGFYIQDTDPVISPEGDVIGQETIEQAVFVPVDINLGSGDVVPTPPADAQVSVDPDAHSVTWSYATGRVELDGVAYNEVTRRGVVGDSATAAAADWNSMRVIDDAFRDIGQPLDPDEAATPCGNPCTVGLENGGTGNSSAVFRLNPTLGFDFEVVVAPPVTPPVTPPVSVPPVVEPPVAPPVEPPLSDEPPVSVPTPSTPPVVEPQPEPEVVTPLIPERVNSGGGYSSPMSTVAAVGALLAAVGSALVSRRRTVKVAR